MSDWYLVDVEERAQENPDTFHIAPRWMRENLVEGDFAKLIFELGEAEGPLGADRMWVKIIERVGPGAYLGELLNIPVVVGGIGQGDEVFFEAENIANLETQKRGRKDWSPRE